ncbi:MAG: DUF2232 domain-containing protein [Sarcina sp.]
MDNSKLSKNIVESAINIAIIFVLILLANNPMFGFLIQIFMPIVIAILYLRTNAKTSITSIIVSILLSAILINPIMALTSNLIYGILGFVLGWCLKNNKKAITTLTFLLITNSIESVIQIFVYVKLFTNVGIKGFFQDILNNIKDVGQMLINITGNNEANLQVVKLINGLTLNDLMNMFPMVIIINSLIISLIIFYFMSIIIKRLGFKVKMLPKFSQWYIDNRIAAILIIVNCIVIFMKVNKFQFGDMMYYTVYTIISIIFSIQGLSVIVYFLKNKFKLTTVFTVIICFILCVGALNIYLFILGIIDLLVDIRGVDPNSLGVFIRKELKLMKK